MSRAEHLWGVSVTGLAMVKHDGTFTWVNRKLAEILGQPASEKVDARGGAGAEVGDRRDQGCAAGPVGALVVAIAGGLGGVLVSVISNAL